MILYGIDNIRELSGHKVGLFWCVRARRLRAQLVEASVCGTQVNLSTVRKNPVCRLGL